MHFGQVWQRLRDHKVLQWTLAYFGVALAIIQGADVLSHTFEWPAYVTRVLDAALIVGLPVVIAIAWYHGHMALEKIGAGELTIIAILLLIGAGLMMVFVPVSKEAAAPATATARAPEVAPSAAVAPATRGKRRLAVLPFTNLSPDPANAFFADGLHEEILSALGTRSRDLEVISRTTMMMYRAAPKPVLEVAKELSATNVLEGSVRRQGNTVRLTLQLIDGRTDEHVWAKNYDRMLVDAMGLQAEVAAEVASQLEVELNGLDRPSPTNDPVAYDLYLKASLPTLTIRDSRERFLAVRALYTEAIRRDRSFMLAYIGRARNIASQLRIYGDTEADLRALNDDIEAARRLAPDAPEVLLADADKAAMEEDYARAMALWSAAERTGGATNAESIVRVLEMQFRLGLPVSTVEPCGRALQLSPGDPLIWVNCVLAAHWSRRPEGAVRLRALIARSPDFPFQIMADQVTFDFTGRAGLQGSWPTGVPELNQLFIQHRYADARRLAVTALPAVAGPGSHFFLLASRVGDEPTRALRLGELDLLLADAASAAAQGREILAFVAAQKPTRYTAWYLALLESSGKLYGGDFPGALAAAKAAQDLMPRKRDAVQWAIARGWAARIYAWAGEQEAAAEMLEELATITPGLAPAMITRDPRFAVPLARNARYRALSARLEQQMKSTRLD